MLQIQENWQSFWPGDVGRDLMWHTGPERTGSRETDEREQFRNWRKIEELGLGTQWWDRRQHAKDYDDICGPANLLSPKILRSPSLDSRNGVPTGEKPMDVCVCVWIKEAAQTAEYAHWSHQSGSATPQVVIVKWGVLLLWLPHKVMMKIKWRAEKRD